MHLHLSPNSGKPIYVQIVEQVKHLIGSGRLRPGDEMPTVRALAQQLVVNPNTVLRAYRELETLGLLTKRRGAGTFVSGNGSPLARSARKKILSDAADALLVEARHLGFSYEDLVALLRARHEGMEKNDDR